MVLQIKYQSNHVLATELFNDLNKLNFWHEFNLEKYKNEPTRLNIFKASHEKLKKYMCSASMPSIEIFKASRFLDPRQFKYLDKDINVYTKALPELKKSTTEWLLYTDIVKESSFDTVFHIDEFWLSNRKIIPQLFEIVEWLLYFPTNSADCERSISSYNNILRDDRNRLLKENLSILNFILFNGKRCENRPIVNEESDESEDNSSCIELSDSE